MADCTCACHVYHLSEDSTGRCCECRDRTPEREVERLRVELSNANLQLSEVTAHRDRLRDMMNDVRGLLLCPPADLEVQIMRRIEDGAITEKRNDKQPHPPRAEGDLAPPGNAAGDAASASAPARLVPCPNCGFFHGPDCVTLRR